MTGYLFIIIIIFFFLKKRGQHPAILTEQQIWSINDLLFCFTFKLKLQNKNKQTTTTTKHETVLLGEKFFSADWCKISVYFKISM